MHFSVACLELELQLIGTMEHDTRAFRVSCTEVGLGGGLALEFYPTEIWYQDCLNSYNRVYNEVQHIVQKLSLTFLVLKYVQNLQNPSWCTNMHMHPLHASFPFPPRKKSPVWNPGYWQTLHKFNHTWYQHIFSEALQRFNIWSKVRWTACILYLLAL